MSSRRLIDTNLIVRHLVQDNPRHAKVAAALFAASDRGDLKLIVLPSVLAECVFVLESFYKQPRQKIAMVLASVISSPGLEIDDLAAHLDALDRYARTKLHFIDCTIAAVAVSRGLPVSTFDTDFKKVADVTVKID